MWKLGEVRSNAKGGKFLCMEPLFWQSEASLEIPCERGAAPQRELRNRRALEALLGAGRDRSGRAAGGRIVRQRLLPSVRQSRGGDWTLKAKLPAHARFWNAGGTFADRPAELAHCAARVRLRARSLWLMSGMCRLSLEVTDLRVEPPSRECPL